MTLGLGFHGLSFVRRSLGGWKLCEDEVPALSWQAPETLSTHLLTSGTVTSEVN